MRLISDNDKLAILLIEDSAGDAMLIQKALKLAIPEAHSVDRVENLEALKQLEETHYDVALLDRSLPDVEGFEGLHSIQNMAPHLPIVFLTAYQDEDVAFAAIEQGAQDYLYKDQIDGHTIKRAIQYAVLRKQFEEVLIVRANFDMLTGLANRMLFESRVEMAIARAKRAKSSIAIMYLDLDRFKQVNDTHGHSAGDAVLKEVARRLKGALRPYDTIARLGGDEFAILLDDQSSADNAHGIAQKLLEVFSEPIVYHDQALDIGVSIGGLMNDVSAETKADALIHQADQAMYQAKRQEGNCAHFADMTQDAHAAGSNLK